MTVRAFVEPGSVAADGGGVELLLDRDEAHYVERVRRCRVGQTIELLDGIASAWTATITRMDSRVGVRVLHPRPSRAAPNVTLLLAVIDPAPTVRVIEQANELGAREISLVHCSRSQGRAPKRDRIDKILRASSRQCGRARPVTVVGPVHLEERLEAGGDGALVIAWAGAPHGAKPWPAADAVTALVGPEGGFVDTEVRAAQQAGFRAESLGPFILRSETAAIASLTLALSSLSR